MKRKTLFGVVAGIGAAALLTGAAWSAATESGADAPPPPGMHHGGPGMMIPGLFPPHALKQIGEELGLTPEQHQTIKGLFDQAKPGFEQLHKQMRANAELLVKTRPDDSAYQTVVANVSQSTSEVTAQLVLQGSQLRAQIFAVLTPEQKAKLPGIEQRMEQRFEGHRHGPAAN